MTKWAKVEECKPTQGSRVLAYSEDLQNYFITYYRDGLFYEHKRIDTTYYPNVTQWLPIPKVEKL